MIVSGLVRWQLTHAQTPNYKGMYINYDTTCWLCVWSGANVDFKCVVRFHCQNFSLYKNTLINGRQQWRYCPDRCRPTCALAFATTCWSFIRCKEWDDNRFTRCVDQSAAFKHTCAFRFWSTHTTYTFHFLALSCLATNDQCPTNVYMKETRSRVARWIIATGKGRPNKTINCKNCWVQLHLVFTADVCFLIQIQ